MSVSEGIYSQWSPGPTPPSPPHLENQRCSLTCSARPLMSHCSIRSYIRSTDHFRSTSALTDVGLCYRTLCWTSANKMQKRTENFGAQLPFTDSPQKTLFKRSTTCLPKITFILQDAPCKMLTFAQLMDKMAPLICEDRKALEDKLRICLSRNKCFVKVPDLEHTYRNYWKLDYSQITAKMVRRHFIGILHLFPELASIVRTKKFRLNTGSKHQPAACRAVQVRSEVKFSGPFSIESLLKRDSPSAQASTASRPSSVTLRAEQQQLRSAGTKRSFSWDSEERLLLQPPSGSSSISSAGGSTYHGATAAGAAESIRRMSECTEASFPVYTRARAAPYFSSQHSSYITYSVPAFTHDALQF